MSHDTEEWCKVFKLCKDAKSQDVHCNSASLTKVYNIWAKKSKEDLCLIILKIDANFEEKMICGFIIRHDEFGEFHRSTQTL